MEAHKTLPHSDELERMVLSACVHFPSDRAIVVEQLSADDFYTPRNAELFAVLRAAAKTGKPCDELLLRDLCRDMPNALALLSELAITLHPDIAALCERLRALSAARRLTRAAFEVAAAGIESTAEPNAFLDRASAQLTKALQSRDSEAKSVGLGELLAEVLDTYDRNTPIVAASCLHTGLSEFDRVVRGLEAGRLYVVAGRPGMGKSALAVQAAFAAAQGGARAVIFSLEMPSHEIATRVACTNARIDSRKLQARDLPELDMRRFVTNTGRIASLPMVLIDAAGMPVEQISRSARQEKLRNGLGVIVVDYLQLVRSSRRHDNREQEVSEISRELKLLARELEVPVIAVSQLNRDVEKRADKRPLMSDLRESGAIEQDADVIALLYREGYYDPNTLYPEECELIIGKNRGGPTGIVRLRFEPEFTRFSDLPIEMRRPATGKGGT